MPLTDLHKRTIQAIVNVFETGTPVGDYRCISILPGDPGHLTYGRSQASLASGNLARLVRGFCAQATSPASAALRPYLPRLEACDVALDSDSALHALLRAAAAEPAMQRAQDALFDRACWRPALRAAQSLNIETPLGVAVIYDSFVHGAWLRIRNATNARVGSPATGATLAMAPIGERGWIAAYIATRREWLARHANPLLRSATYRMDTFAALLEAGNWNLALPFEAHGALIDQGAIAGHDNHPNSSASAGGQDAGLPDTMDTRPS